MTKFEIDIDDAAACENGLRLLYSALVKKHGVVKADRLLWEPAREIKKEQREVCRGITPEDLGLLLAYCDLPNKSGLAKKLAKWNKDRAPDGPFGKHGATDPASMLRQIRRVLLRHSDRLAAIKALSPEQRENAAYSAMIGTLSRRRRIKKRRGNVVRLKPKKKSA